MPLEIGRRLGRYEIDSMLGAGGMGEVYRAVDTRLSRTVAIKVLPARLSHDATRRQRFEREAEAISTLNHPHICTLYDIGSEGDVDFLVMEYLQGETLAQRLTRGPLSVQEALDCAIQIADALDRAHGLGIIHRDLKPGNIMLTGAGAKLLDFGLAKTLGERTWAGESSDSAASTAVGSLTAAGLVVGTPPYMSPEQLQGTEVDTATDVFAFGAVVYEMLTGRRAFDGSSDADVIAAILTGRPRRLGDVRRDVPEALQRLVERCLERDPDNRWQTFRDLVSELRWIAARSDVEIARGGSRQTGRFPRRTRTPAAAAAAGLMVAALALPWILSGTTPDSIAILPLQNRSDDPKLEYLADGITESLISLVSPLPGIRVMSGASVFRYRGQPVDPVSVARELDVDVVLIGRLWLYGDTISINVELIDGRHGGQIWGDQYARPLADLQATQLAISRDVAARLGTTFGDALATQLVRRSSGSTEAYDLYLQGRFHWHRRTPSDMFRAMELFRLAIARDPNYALAHVGLADAYAVMGSNGYDMLPPSEAIRLAEPHVDRALALDDMLAEAHASHGFLLRYKWERAEAERAHRRAVELNPNYVTGRQWLASHLWTLERFDEALAELERARILDPHSPVIQLNIGRHHYYARDFDRAADAFTNALAMDQEYFIAGQLLALAHLLGGRPAAALEQVRATPSRGSFLAVHGYVAASTGDRPKALEVLAALKDRSRTDYVPAYAFATVYTGLGMLDEAFTYLERAHREQSPYLDYLSVEPTLDPLRGDPRFENLLQRVGLAGVPGDGSGGD